MRDGWMTVDRHTVEPTTLIIDLREGPACATVPGDIAGAISAIAPAPPDLDRMMQLAAVVLIRVGGEGGEALLRHWCEHDPAALLDADPRFAEILANEPETLVGPLAGTAAVNLA